MEFQKRTEKLESLGWRKLIKIRRRSVTWGHLLLRNKSHFLPLPSFLLTHQRRLILLNKQMVVIFYKTLNSPLRFRAAGGRGEQKS